ncbi:T-cell-specific guanine nucleotide triphosphate-binding protein 2-like [Echinops telfairi]|uniref:T-cell-specific guanine nucleotide triphosphate-binding protein 2-like n=4 Tax=Echinops telfairi TaxID=9371 RepID=A0AC55CKW7_ECHTE|nr:T-cell-specific guanine nucleotide triphosphate-binding protein 2-like [Echinops telfairi]XP_045140879.1 T-cell-specific guanine nucleotide triphosphate-binding protein 2-like [Echinops telfairi]XP_045140880.1 T-cell-specific guanine nucleotide triphosphate-binding protein 2-like [Echinops telfairi]XP_045140881.1 T-cell-specific guanine nucleotide triphosphate-binding protein 2-like [Echinops telfairi]
MDQFILSFITKNNFQQLSSEFLSYYFTIISKAGGILSQETLSDIQAALQKGNLEDIVKKIQGALVQAENAPLDVAVTGQSGTGKSSFINALRGLSHEEEGTALVGIVETTMEKTPYQHPKYPKVTFWDLPGTGTPNFCADTYLEKMGFTNYDFFIIISSTRFTYNDALLAQKIKSMGKNFYFVRTKVDNDLYNEKISKPTSFNEKKVLQQIRDNCLASLQCIGVPDPHIFLISNFDLADFDFQKLEETLLKELPAHKRHTFMLLVPCLSDAAIEMKRDFLKEKIWLDALKSSALAFIPFMPYISGFDLPEQEKCLNLYRSHFGLGDEAIKNVAQDLGTSVQELSTSMKSLNFWLLVKEDDTVGKLKACLESFSSVKGGLLSLVLQFLKAYHLRMKFLDTVADDAKVILHKILKR